MTYSDYELAQMHVEALFVHTADGRLVRINEPEPGQPAPRFFLTRTPAGNLWRARFDLPDALVAELGRLAATEPAVDDLQTPPRHAAAYAELLKQAAPSQTVAAGPAYVVPEQSVPERAISITPERRVLLQQDFDWLQNDLVAYAPVAAVIRDGLAASVCFSSRLTAVAGEAGVFTAERYRGHGYAPDAVRGWAAGVRALGKLPLYSTSWANAASQKVAKKLGAAQFAVDFSIT